MTNKNKESTRYYSDLQEKSVCKVTNMPLLSLFHRSYIPLLYGAVYLVDSLVCQLIS